MTVKIQRGGFDDCWLCIVPYGFNNNWPKVLEIRRWCRQHFEKGQWGREDLYNESNFIIYREEDVALFVLRWG